MFRVYPTKLCNGIKTTALSIVLLFVFAGCVGPLVTIKVKSKNETAHYLIIGVGIVSVNEENDTVVTVTKSQALGLTVTDRPGLKASLGYASASSISVADGAENVQVEVSQKAGGPLKVSIPSAKIE